MCIQSLVGKFYFSFDLILIHIGRSITLLIILFVMWTLRCCIVDANDIECPICLHCYNVDAKIVDCYVSCGCNA
jgi:hypothetical protein